MKRRHSTPALRIPSLGDFPNHGFKVMLAEQPHQRTRESCKVTPADPTRPKWGSDFGEKKQT